MTKTTATSPHSFNFKEVDEMSVLQELSKLRTNKASGLDGISAKLLRDSAYVIAPYLTKIFKLSLRCGSFPDIWKKGRVTPIFKSGDPTSSNNYRPITILPTLSKLLERIVHHQVYNYLQEHKLLASQQFGFRSKLSTTIALAHFTEQILDNLDHRKITGAVSIDLRKAFDSVDHTIVLEKLKTIGFASSVLDWFCSYLSNRTQVTMINRSVMAAVMFRFALAVFIIFTIKKPSLVGSNSICYSFHYEEVFDTNESLIPSSLWQIRQEYGLNVRSENALKLLLILAGDVELCPGAVVRYSTNDKNERPRLRGFNVAHLNVRSMINKIDALRMLVEEKSFDIFTISET